MGILLAAPGAFAQSSVGSGPLTGTLTDTEPTSGVLSLGPVKVAPGIVVREIGWDSNVFDEATDEDPKEDYVAAASPDLALFWRTRFARISAYTGAELTYYRTYATERSVGYAGRGRVDFLLSRVRPFIGGGRTQTRLRPNGEVDVRADRREEEFSGGLAFDLGAHYVVYGAAVRATTEFRDAFQEGLDLGQSLNRDGYDYMAGLKTDLTPLTSLTLSGGYREDRFRSDTLRDSTTRYATARLQFRPEAVITGVAEISYRDFVAVDPAVKGFRGVTGTLGLMVPILEVGRLSLTGSRGLEYSFDAADAYYLGNTFTAAYTHRLFGMVDWEIRGGRSVFDYGYREGVPPRTDTLDTAGTGFGYNLANRTRISINYEVSRRRSAALLSRNYERQRAYMAWTYAF